MRSEGIERVEKSESTDDSAKKEKENDAAQRENDIEKDHGWNRGQHELENDGNESPEGDLDIVDSDLIHRTSG